MEIEYRQVDTTNLSTNLTDDQQFKIDIKNLENQVKITKNNSSWTLVIYSSLSPF